jgi:TatD DNase family protein
MLIDTHVHLYAEEFNEDRDQLLAAALEAGVEKFLLPNIDITSVDGMMVLCDNNPHKCYPMIGLHPCYVKEDYRQQLDKIFEIAEQHKKEIIAIGEIGLDFYWDVTFREQQELVFIEQVYKASELNLPVAIHSRNSTDRIIELLLAMESKRPGGVFHCFSGTSEQAAIITGMGYMLGIGGVVTFKNSGLDKVLAGISISNIILETDGPYLAPAPYRGKRNEPAYLKIIAEKVADVYKMPFEEVSAITTANAAKLFNLNIYNG